MTLLADALRLSPDRSRVEEVVFGRQIAVKGGGHSVGRIGRVGDRLEPQEARQHELHLLLGGALRHVASDDAGEDQVGGVAECEDVRPRAPAN